MPKNNKTLTVKVANHVAEYLEQLAKEAGVTIDDIAAYFFANEVVHTSRQMKGLPANYFFRFGVVHT